MKLSSTFIFLGVVAVVASTGNGLVGAVARYKMTELGDQLQVAAEVKQRHMEGDMMHDAIWGSTMGVMIANYRQDAQLAAFYRQRIDEDAREFANHLEMNLATDSMPEPIREIIRPIQQDLTNYVALSNKVIAQNDPDQVTENLASFDRLYKKLESEQEQISEKIEAWQNGLHQQLDNVKFMMMWVGTAISVVAVMIALVLQAFVQIGVFHHLNKMMKAMNKIAAGETDAEVPYSTSKNEIGDMARSVQVFRDNAVKVQNMVAERAQQEQKAMAEKRESMRLLAESFENNVKNVVEMVASAATQMDSSAQHVTRIAEESQHKLSSLTNEVGAASGNVETVALATSQLSESITEINRQVIRATTITTEAVAEAQRADGTVQELVAAAGKIGEVVDMINAIAEQINLLALNATIEAARAGEAGKGFAVVASEVKSLATETTKATSEISSYINSIQATTNETVSVIQIISTTIREINEIATVIATAVEEQGAATKDIAHNVQQAADSTRDASQEVETVSKSASDTQEAAKQMTGATAELNRQSGTLRSEVEKFLAGVRSAA